ncbi:MAG TPA: aspartyl protease family protein [Bacteroidia bacterium]|nr:aspartyl protease family protein [Bacteroidia bacterium]
MNSRLTQVVFFAVAVLLLTGCNLIKTVKVLKKGEVVQKNFREEVSFESRAGLIIVKVNVNGRDYHFIFDSGASNCVTKEVAAELSLKPVINQTAEDAEGKQGGVQFALLNEIKIGKISFTNTAAAIIDLKQVPELACLKVDGLIGGNLMRKVFWQIDYVKQKLVVASCLDSLHVAQDAAVFSFSPLLSGTPVVEVDADGIKSSGNIFDTGSSGSITLSGPTFKKVVKKNAALKYARGAGSNSAGLYGAGNDTEYVAEIKNLNMGTLTLANRAIEFRREKGNLGSDFFKDYIVSLNWKSNKIYFSPQVKEISQWETFGFAALKNGRKLVVTFLFESSPAAEAGVKPGDEILSINGKDYSNLTDEGYCEMVVNRAPWKNEKNLQMVLKTTDGTQKTVTLEKRNLLNTK